MLAESDRIALWRFSDSVRVSVTRIMFLVLDILVLVLLLPKLVATRRYTLFGLQ